jgi:uncharacterized protein (DUF2147 family)
MRKMLLAAAVTLILAGPAAAEPDAAFGQWLTAGGKSRVEVAPCGEALCATVRWIAAEVEGRPLLDARNPDSSLRARTLRGAKILEGLTRTAAGWRGGRGYDPERGMHFRPAELTPLPDGTMRLKGCVGVFCETQVWRRAG